MANPAPPVSTASSAAIIKLHGTKIICNLKLNWISEEWINNFGGNIGYLLAKVACLLLFSPIFRISLISSRAKLCPADCWSRYHCLRFWRNLRTIIVWSILTWRCQKIKEYWLSYPFYSISKKIMTTKTDRKCKDSSTRIATSTSPSYFIWYSSLIRQ